MYRKTTIEINGKNKEAICPVILSASRATDIPAFYSDWLIEKFKNNYVEKINPFNNKISILSFEDVRFIVFWSKNPEPIIEKLNFFDKRKINYYFQFTLNDYSEYELNLPSLEKRINTFKKLSDKIGKQKVIWRFDPLILSNEITEENLLERIYKVGKKINRYTQKLVFSFVDLKYRKVQLNLKKHGFLFHILDFETKNRIAKQISEFAKEWEIEISTCAEQLDFLELGIKHNKCIDDELIANISENDKVLQNYLGCEFNIFENKIICKKSKKDKNQRKFCGCIESKDIGFYDSCLHQCIYCYANSNFKKSAERYSEVLKSLKKRN